MSRQQLSTRAPRWINGDTEMRRYQREPGTGFSVKNPVPGVVLDISATGLGIECGTSLEVLKPHLFTLSIGTSRAKVMGEVRWCRLTRTRLLPNGDPAPVYRAGIAFVDH